MSGHGHIAVNLSGVWVSPQHPFLGASSDAAIYDPSESKAFGFAEVKCPYKYKDVSPKMRLPTPPFVAN